MVYPPKQGAFTLIELAIVMLIVGILGVGLTQPLSTLHEHKQRSQATQELEAMREGLMAHAVANGYLPCPIDLQKELQSEDRGYSGYNIGSQPVVEQTSGVVCKTAMGGVSAFLAGGLGEADNRGALLDPWGRPYRYAVSLYNHVHLGDESLPDWTSLGEASRIGSCFNECRYRVV